MGWILTEFLHLTLWEWGQKKLKIEKSNLKKVFLFVFLAFMFFLPLQIFYEALVNLHL